MHKKYGKDGLVVLSVIIDQEQADREEAIKFLKKLQVPFSNFIIAPDENRDRWEEELKLGIFPVSDLYARDGKLQERLEAVEPEEMDKKVEEALKKK